MSLLASPNRQPGTICHNAVCSMRDSVTNVCRLNVGACADHQPVEGRKSSTNK